MQNEKDLINLQDIINYKFLNESILINSLTHSSYSNEFKTNDGNNERLEFLGDSVLSLIISKYIYNQYPDYPEGNLTKLRSKVVCEEILCKAAKKIDLGEYLLLGKGEEQSGGRERQSILADAFEAIIAAIYLDGGFEVASEFTLNILKKYITLAIKGKIVVDYKSLLQEHYQGLHNPFRVKYILDNEIGPDHEKTFSIHISANNIVVGTGIGKTKKMAEQNAAKNALINLGVIDE